MKRILLAGCAAMAIGGPAAWDASADMITDWHYALDSLNDGSGGASYEYLAMATRQQGNQLVFALSTNMPLTGNTAGNGGTLNQSIAHGDLWLNFTGQPLTSASDFNDPGVFAVRFSAANDSLGNTPATPNATLGLFGDITPAALATSNRGYKTLQAYLNAGYGRQSGAMGDLESSTLDVVPYLGNGVMQTHVAAGTWLSDVALLDAAELASAGLDFAQFGSGYVGTQVFGFAIDAGSLPVSEFTAHLLMECTNDGIAIESATVPEPATVALAGLAAATVLYDRPRQRRRSRA